MIAMTLGAFVIGGIISVFITSGQSYRLQQAISQVQDKGRFSVKKLREGIQTAGFKLDYNTVAIKEIVGGVDECTIDATVKILEVYWYYIDPELDQSKDSEMRYCFYLRGDKKLVRRRISGPADKKPGTSVAEDEFVILADVHHLDFSFAVDLDGVEGIDIVPPNSTYMTADKLQVGTGSTAATTATWQKVRAVRINIIVASDIPNVTDDPQTLIVPFWVEDENGIKRRQFQAPDKRLYQEYSATIALRNRKH
ncbi:MAG: hypothetical protein OFPI_11030 [Osedax symbiont Rs2]|nr:MAG: hypothetical protein OFPII_38290 [Osedax symbiont Rs1]EPJ53363.1 MAG: hypothetical protein OFPI_11030 [Osedax symbiont Rs2]